mmetsp:Transcript_77829/g.209755  ORF Transcript_77829/g.209755 Transcript_77829/m.209755 type:complete len:92 (+) Transcript_77829:76-351(+)
MSSQSELADPPKDGISALQFAPEHNLLLASSWSAEVRMYDVVTNSKKAQYSHKAAVLDCCWGADQTRCRPYCGWESVILRCLLIIARLQVF